MSFNGTPVIEQRAGHELERVVNARLPKGSENRNGFRTPHSPLKKRVPDHLPPGKRVVYLNDDGSKSKAPTNHVFSAKFVGDSKYRDAVRNDRQTRSFIHLAKYSDLKTVVFYVRWRDDFPLTESLKYDPEFCGLVLPPRTWNKKIIPSKKLRELARDNKVKIRLVSDPAWR